jgi:hypothetical protein
VVEVVELLGDVGHAVLGHVEAGLEVGAGREPATGAGHEHRAHGRVRGVDLDHLLELAPERGRPGVERVRPVEGDSRGGAVLLPDQVLVAHGA